MSKVGHLPYLLAAHFRGRGLTSRSQVWHGTTCRQSYGPRSLVVEQMVLGKSLDLLPGALLRQAGDLVTISSHLPSETISPGQLRTGAFHLRILLLDCLQCSLFMHSRQLLLDSEYRPGGEGNLSEPSGRLVSSLLSHVVPNIITNINPGSSTLHSTS